MDKLSTDTLLSPLHPAWKPILKGSWRNNQPFTQHYQLAFLLFPQPFVNNLLGFNPFANFSATQSRSFWVRAINNCKLLFESPFSSYYWLVAQSLMFLCRFSKRSTPRAFVPRAKPAQLVCKTPVVHSLTNPRVNYISRCFTPTIVVKRSFTTYIEYGT